MMNDKERSELAALLQQRRSELEDATHRLRTALASPAETGWPEVRDSVEDGDARMMATLDVTSLRRQEAELREVVEAQQRMESGEYGRCETDDEPIPIERLRVRPEARFCLRHEEAWEHAHPAPAPDQS
jgi:DnaK suppressor protein